MNKFDREIMQMIDLENNEVPENVKERIEDVLESLPERKINKNKTIVFSRVMASVACAAVIALFIMPNMSSAYAQAAGKVPVIGGIIRTFTIRNYSYSDDAHEMNMDVPSVEVPGSSGAADIINKDISQIAQDLAKEFNSKFSEGNNATYLGYDVITQNEKWFTLKLEFSVIRASGENYHKYYHIDKMSGRYIELSDLFSNDGYITAISDDILSQMKLRMEQDEYQMYWIDADGGSFEKIDADQSFYLNENDDLVIKFNEYEVGPGYMGSPEFVIGKDVYFKFIKEEYADIF